MLNNVKARFRVSMELFGRGQGFMLVTKEKQRKRSSYRHFEMEAAGVIIALIG